MGDSDPGRTVHDFCTDILGRGDLAAKLAAPLNLVDPASAAPVAAPPETPARAPDLALISGSNRLPRPGALRDPAARAECLARFAHHELMAVEIFAWALLRWPDLPPALRRSWLGVLAEEQTHCHLYLDRLRAHGSDLSEHTLGDYFWKHVPAISASPHGPSAFVAAMGLTLEQANLDFTLVYRDAFRSAGDEESARVCERVHADEVGHVRIAAQWITRLPPARAREDDLEAYVRTVPFPFSATRAKGRRFDAPARRRAGLSDRFIEYVKTARSGEPQQPTRIPFAAPPPGEDRS